MSLNLGINVVEVDGATPSIVGAPTSVAGFVIRSQRGVPGIVRQVSNFTQFTDYFGSYVAEGKDATGTQTSYIGAYAIRGFFDNGGSLAYVSRVVDRNVAAPASAAFSIVQANGTPVTITLTTAFRGQADFGTWGNAVDGARKPKPGLAAFIVPNPNATDAFDITIAWATPVRGTTAYTYRTLESWTKLVIGGAPGAQDPGALNDPDTGSKYVSVASTTVALNPWEENKVGGYQKGDTVTHQGNVYIAGSGGPSTSKPPGPSGTGGPDGDVTWTQASGWKGDGQYSAAVSSNGNFYVATVGGLASGPPTGPAGTGSNISDGEVTWAYVPSWQPSTRYVAGSTVTDGKNVYVATVGGRSGPTSPKWTGASISDGNVIWVTMANVTGWTTGTSYGAVVTNDSGKVYFATSGGKAATSGGPTGKGSSISDGRVVWTFLNTAAWNPGTVYVAGAAVTTTAGTTNTYVATKAGTSAADGPTGTGTEIKDGIVDLKWNYQRPSVPATWAANTSYFAGNMVAIGANVYQVIPGGDGTSATGPTGISTAISDGSVTWCAVQSTSAAAWTAKTGYAVGACVTNGPDNATYVAISVQGTTPKSGSGGPQGKAPNISDGDVTWAFVPATPPAWQPAVAYTVGAVVSNGAGLYVVTTAGTSAGPAGTGSSIPDGTVVWAYVPPVPPVYTRFQNGADDGLSGAALDTQLAAQFTVPSPFDPYDIELLACPETTKDSAKVIQAALTYCFNRGDCMFVGHVPDGLEQPDAKAFGKKFQADRVYGALYYPYIQVVDPIGTTIWIPPEGHVMGVYARTDQQRGIWKAPAGNGALMQNALDVRERLTDTDHTDLVKNGSVNAIRPITGAGIVVDSSRTLSTNTLWLYVNVRLLFNYVKTSLKYGLRWVVQEPNDTTLWNKIKYNSVTPFLMGLWRRGAFGPGAPKDVFTVKVDAENNKPDTIEKGELYVEVYFYPSRPAETIVITVGQQEGAATATEG